jgi:hypothetical protein
MSKEMPAEIRDLVEMVRTSVARVIGVEPDLTPETLPLIDQYIRQVPVDSPPEVKELVVVTTGCYFGEVVRRKLNGRWSITGPSPDDWRIEMIDCFLHLKPVGMAGEVLTGAESEDYDGSFGTSDDSRDGLAEALAEAAPVTEEEYYSLSARIDILQLAADWLVARQAASGKPKRTFSAEDYSIWLDLEEPDED